MSAAIDYLSACDVEIMATGACFSAAVPILACGSKRIATTNTRFLVHPGKAMMEAERNLRDITLEQEELERLEHLYCATLARRTRKSEKWWMERSMESTYFGPREALQWGLIDKIV